jgi:hypothetical protein
MRFEARGLSLPARGTVVNEYALWYQVHRMGVTEAARHAPYFVYSG